MTLARYLFTSDTRFFIAGIFGSRGMFCDRPARFLELPLSQRFDRIQKQELLSYAHSASGLPTELLIVVMNFCQPCHWF